MKEPVLCIISKKEANSVLLKNQTGIYIWILDLFYDTKDSESCIEEYWKWNNQRAFFLVQHKIKSQKFISTQLCRIIQLWSEWVKVLNDICINYNSSKKNVFFPFSFESLMSPDVRGSYPLTTSSILWRFVKNCDLKCASVGRKKSPFLPHCSTTFKRFWKMIVDFLFDEHFQ